MDVTFHDTKLDTMGNIIIKSKLKRTGSTVIVQVQYGSVRESCEALSEDIVMTLLNKAFENKGVLKLIVITQKYTEQYTLFVLKKLKDMSATIVLVCSKCDLNIFSSSFILDVNKIDANIVRCFSTQLEDAQILPNQTSHLYPHLIPIGILHYTPGWCRVPVNIPHTNVDNLMYVNFTAPYPFLARNHLASLDRAHVLEELLKNGFTRSPKVEYIDMIKRMSEYKFCACPRGIGPDTYRFWESICVGCIPVATDWKRLRHQYAGKLPAVWVDETHYADTFNLWKEKKSTCDLFHVNEFGDIIFSRWKYVTKHSLRMAYRFVAWKRFNKTVMKTLYTHTWFARILGNMYS